MLNTSIAAGTLAALMAAYAAVPAWYDTYPIVAHALGTVDGRRETNSKEAFLSSYAQGQRVFETDLNLTSDGALVCRHDFDQTSYANLEQTYAGVMTHAQFLRTKINYLYTPLDVDGLLELLEAYPDTYLITDSKETEESAVRREFRALNAAIEATGDEGLYDRIIVQIYNEEMFSTVQEECPVSNWVYTLYQTAEPDYDRVGAFCRDNGIGVVTLDKSRCSQAVNDTLHSYGVKTYYHTVYQMSSIRAMGYLGADGYYTDYITLPEYEQVFGTKEEGT